MKMRRLVNGHCTVYKLLFCFILIWNCNFALGSGFSEYYDSLSNFYDKVKDKAEQTKNQLTDTFNSYYDYVEGKVRNVYKMNMNNTFSFPYDFNFNSEFFENLDNGQFFVEGLIEGISEVPLDQNLCYSESKKVYGQINKVLVDLFNFEEIINFFSLKEDNLFTGLIEMERIYKKLNDMWNLKNTLSKNCHLDYLLIQTVSFESYSSIWAAKTAYNLFLKREVVYHNMVELYKNIHDDRDSRKAGEQLGKTLKIIFDSST